VARAVAAVGDREFPAILARDQYPHFRLNVVSARESKLVRADIRTLARTVGYRGCSDKCPPPYPRWVAMTFLSAADLLRTAIQPLRCHRDRCRLQYMTRFRANYQRLFKYVKWRHVVVSTTRRSGPNNTALESPRWPTSVPIHQDQPRARDCRGSGHSPIHSFPCF
jgi:hypothetical protein